MKYIEELSFGDCFAIKDMKYILTTDCKNNGYKMCVCLQDGSIRWIASNHIIENIDIFTVDKESNILAIKERKKNVDISN